MYYCLAHLYQLIQWYENLKILFIGNTTKRDSNLKSGDCPRRWLSVRLLSCSHLINSLV